MRRSIRTGRSDPAADRAGGVGRPRTELEGARPPCLVKGNSCCGRLESVLSHVSSLLLSPPLCHAFFSLHPLFSSLFCPLQIISVFASSLFVLFSLSLSPSLPLFLSFLLLLPSSFFLLPSSSFFFFFFSLLVMFFLLCSLFQKKKEEKRPRAAEKEKRRKGEERRREEERLRREEEEERRDEKRTSQHPSP